MINTNYHKFSNYHINGSQSQHINRGRSMSQGSNAELVTSPSFLAHGRVRSVSVPIQNRGQSTNFFYRKQSLASRITDLIQRIFQRKPRANSVYNVPQQQQFGNNTSGPSRQAIRTFRGHEVHQPRTPNTSSTSQTSQLDSTDVEQIQNYSTQLKKSLTELRKKSDKGADGMEQLAIFLDIGKQMNAEIGGSARSKNVRREQANFFCQADSQIENLFEIFQKVVVECKDPSELKKLFKICTQMTISLKRTYREIPQDKLNDREAQNLGKMILKTEKLLGGIVLDRAKVSNDGGKTHTIDVEKFNQGLEELNADIDCTNSVLRGIKNQLREELKKDPTLLGRFMNDSDLEYDVKTALRAISVQEELDKIDNKNENNNGEKATEIMKLLHQIGKQSENLEGATMTELTDSIQKNNLWDDLLNAIQTMPADQCTLEDIELLRSCASFQKKKHPTDKNNPSENYYNDTVNAWVLNKNLTNAEFTKRFCTTGVGITHRTLIDNSIAKEKFAKLTDSEFRTLVDENYSAMYFLIEKACTNRAEVKIANAKKNEDKIRALMNSYDDFDIMLDHSDKNMKTEQKAFFFNSITEFKLESSLLEFKPANAEEERRYFHLLGCVTSYCNKKKPSNDLPKKIENHIIDIMKKETDPAKCIEHLRNMNNSQQNSCFTNNLEIKEKVIDLLAGSSDKNLSGKDRLKNFGNLITKLKNSPDDNIDNQMNLDKVKVSLFADVAKKILSETKDKEKVESTYTAVDELNKFIEDQEISGSDTMMCDFIQSINNENIFEKIKNNPDQKEIKNFATIAYDRMTTELESLERTVEEERKTATKAAENAKIAKGTKDEVEANEYAGKAAKTAEEAESKLKSSYLLQENINMIFVDMANEKVAEILESNDSIDNILKNVAKTIIGLDSQFRKIATEDDERLTNQLVQFALKHEKDDATIFDKLRKNLQSVNISEDKSAITKHSEYGLRAEIYKYDFNRKMKACGQDKKKQFELLQKEFENQIGKCKSKNRVDLGNRIELAFLLERFDDCDLYEETKKKENEDFLKNIKVASGFINPNYTSYITNMTIIMDRVDYIIEKKEELMKTKFGKIRFEKANKSKKHLEEIVAKIKKHFIGNK